MSHFYGDIQGNRGTSTKGGSKASGVTGHVRGWNVGARVTVHHDASTDRDIVTVYATNGSNGGRHDVRIARFTADTFPEGGRTVFFHGTSLREHTSEPPYSGENADQVIPDDGFMDGGHPYTDDELAIINAFPQSQNRPATPGNRRHHSRV